MPDETREQAKARRAAMKKASAKQNVYALVAAPYLAAKRTLDLYEGYRHLDEITADYDSVLKARSDELEAERKRQAELEEQRRIDRESREAEKRLHK